MISMSTKQKKQIQIAIDGYSACGKSTLARALAKELGYTYVDSGAMHRAVALYAIQDKIWDGQQFDIERLRKDIDSIKVTFDTRTGHTLLNGSDVEQSIRTLEVARPASIVASYDFVRSMLVAQQRELGRKGGIVMDGRDIGTVVFPQAELKIFLTATPEIRVKRRYEEMRSRGESEITIEMVRSDLAERDYRDSHRAINPLRQAEDAVVIDNSSLTIDEQTNVALELARQREQA